MYPSVLKVVVGFSLLRVLGVGVGVWGCCYLLLLSEGLLELELEIPELLLISVFDGFGQKAFCHRHFWGQFGQNAFFQECT